MVATYADRVHDAVLRADCPGSEAPEVLEEAVGHLLDVLVRRPADVRDLLGCWLRQAELLAGRRSSSVHVRRDDADAARVRAVLAALEAPDRRVLMLRDAYDLPPGSAAVALDLDLAELRGRLATARLRFLRRYEAAALPVVPTERSSAEHSSTAQHSSTAEHSAMAPCATDAAELGALSDRTLPPARAAALRRHNHGCLRCEEVADGQERVRRIIGSLPLIGLDPRARTALTARTAVMAERRLSVLDAILDGRLDARPATDGQHPGGRGPGAAVPGAGAVRRRPLLSPAVVAVAIAAALLAGVATGLSGLRVPFLRSDRTVISQQPAAPNRSRPATVVSPARTRSQTGNHPASTDRHTIGSSGAGSGHR